MAGYSGTPLEKKLGIREGYRIALVNEPEGFSATVAWPNGAQTTTSSSAKNLDLVVLFVQHEDELRKEFQRWARKLSQAGSLWVAWPKLAARKKLKIDSDITEDSVRAAAFPCGFVDVKVCAIDDVWSGLKCVLRVENRGATSGNSDRAKRG